MTSQTIFNAILNRRSVSPKRLQSPGPTPEEIETLTESACAAPSHGRLTPAHFVYIPDDKRDQLADVFEAAAIDANPDVSEESRGIARQRSYNAPCLLAMIVTIDNDRDDVPPHEQWLCAGASMQNMLLVAEELGYKAMIVSGLRVRSRPMREAFFLEENQTLVGFIAVGNVSEGTRKNTRERTYKQTLQCW